MKKDLSCNNFFEKDQFFLEDHSQAMALYEIIYPDNQPRQLRLLECTEPFLLQSGFSKNELLAMSNVQDYVFPLGMPDDLVTPNVFDVVVSSNPAFLGMFRWKRPDNQRKFIEYSARLSQKQGRFYLLGIYHDVTDKPYDEDTSFDKKIFTLAFLKKAWADKKALRQG